MRAAANTANRPPIIAAVVTTPPADNDAAPEPSRTDGGSVTPGGRVAPGGKRVGAADGPPVKEKSLDPAVGPEVAMSSTEVGAAVGTPVLEVGEAVWAVGVGAMVKAKSRDPAVGAMVAPGARGATVAPGAMVRGATGEGVKVPLTITHGAAPSHGTPVAAIVAEQQSEAPLVPAIAPQPTPPHTPLQASAQQMLPSATPGSPLGQVEGVTSAKHAD